MNYNEEYSRWLTSATADADVAAELKAIENDPATPIRRVCCKE